MKSTHLAVLSFTASISKVFQGSMRIFSKKLPHPDLVGVLCLNHLSSLESLSLLFFGIDSTLGTVTLVLASNKSIESMRGGSVFTMSDSRISSFLQPAEEKEALLLKDEYKEKMSESTFLYLTLDLPTAPLYKDEKEQLIIPQVPLFNILAKFNGNNEKVFIFTFIILVCFHNLFL